MAKYAYTYDGSSTWSIGPEDDPQSNAMLTVFDRNDDRARGLALSICAALNDGRLVMKSRPLDGVLRELRDTWEKRADVVPACVAADEAIDQCAYELAALIADGR